MTGQRDGEIVCHSPEGGRGPTVNKQRSLRVKERGMDLAENPCVM